MNCTTRTLLLGLLVIMAASARAQEIPSFTGSATSAPTSDPSKLMQATPPAMVRIDAGTFTIGQKNEYVTAPRNSQRRQLTVSNFYMDQYEVTNLAWQEYESWTKNVFSQYNNIVITPDSVLRGQIDSLLKSVVPDSTVWRDEMAYNDPYVENYYRHYSFKDYPVVGISWEQAMAYCRWRTDRVNENVLIEIKFLTPPQFNGKDILPTMEFTAEEIEEFLKNNHNHPEYAIYDGVKKDSMYILPYEWIRRHYVFNTEKYLFDDNYKPTPGSNLKDKKKVTRADGVLWPSFRLPTEAEWEFAAIGRRVDKNGVIDEGKMLPWEGYTPRTQGKPKVAGIVLANFTRQSGDLKGTVDKPDDGYIITAPVNEFAIAATKNGYNLYNMAGNVSEWVLDVYRETTIEDMAEYNPYRGNEYTRIVRDQEGNPVLDVVGCVMSATSNPEDDKRDFKDGDMMSRIDTDYPLDTTGLTVEQMDNVKQDPTDVLAPRINNQSRVYKGGSWNDRLYWLYPTTRRYMDQKKKSSTIGFRCAMSIVGK